MSTPQMSFQVHLLFVPFSSSVLGTLIYVIQKGLQYIEIEASVTEVKVIIYFPVNSLVRMVVMPVLPLNLSVFFLLILLFKIFPTPR